MGPAEIAWRVRSLLRDQADLVRIPLGILPRLPATSLLPAEGYTVGFRCCPVTGSVYQDAAANPAWRNALRSAADRILENRLSYFDLDAVDHGDPFNWHRDHSAGIDVPVRLSVLTDYRDFGTFGDCKLVWEPNRHHQLVVLARAYTATGDARYAEKIAELLRSWLDANPFGYGMNWKSPLELGVRIINWVWAIDMIRDSGAVDARLWNDVQQSLYQAMWDGQRKFSRGSSANNHLIGEAAGVFFGACYFQSYPSSAAWANRSQAVLEREILLQTGDDGGTLEHAFGYQFFVIQFFTHCMLAGEAAGYPFSAAFRKRLHAMYRFLHELSADTGEPPNMGDRDDGYVLDLGDLPDSAQALLAVGAELFDDPGLLPDKPSETVFWLTGKTAQGARPEQVLDSRSFSDSGYYLLRSPRTSVFFDCAPLGYGPIAAHGHADCLSIGLNLDGEAVIVDAGTYDYFTYPEWRNYFRETRAHNTVEVDEQSQSEMLGPFLWGRRASARLIDWQDDASMTRVCGEHDGYTYLSDPVVHRRSLHLDKPSGALTITDELAASGSHKVRVHFHLSPSWQARQRSDTEIEIVNGGSRLALQVNGAAITCIAASDVTKLGWISPGYHRRVPSTCIRLERNIDANATIVTRITPD